jgi:hypothetical protein
LASRIVEAAGIVGLVEAAALAARSARAPLEMMCGTAVNGYGAAQSGVRWRQQAIIGAIALAD